MTVEEIRALVFAAVAGMIGLGLGVPNAIAVWRGLQARRWHQTRGRIISDGVTFDHYGGDRDITRGPAVEYAFKVEGQSHVGRRISFARTVPVWSTWTTPIFGPPFDILAGLRRGTEVDVWYDPEDPARAVLRPGVDYGFVLLALFGAACLCISATLFFGVLVL